MRLCLALQHHCASVTGVITQSPADGERIWGVGGMGWPQGRLKNLRMRRSFLRPNPLAGPGAAKPAGKASIVSLPSVTVPTDITASVSGPSPAQWRSGRCGMHLRGVYSKQCSSTSFIRAKTVGALLRHRWARLAFSC